MQGLAWDAYIMYNCPQSVAREVSLRRIAREQAKSSTSAKCRHNRQYTKSGEAATHAALFRVME
jgi:hypothetical protein